jgi:hypothetical protein
MSMENNVGFVKNAKNHFLGLIKKTNKQKRGFGLRDGLLRGILSDSFPSKAITVKLKSDESSTTGCPNRQSQIRENLESISI